jgi:hypothetical protein
VSHKRDSAHCDVARLAAVKMIEDVRVFHMLSDKHQLYAASYSCGRGRRSGQLGFLLWPFERASQASTYSDGVPAAAYL